MDGNSNMQVFDEVCKILLQFDFLTAQRDYFSFVPLDLHGAALVGNTNSHIFCMFT